MFMARTFTLIALVAGLIGCGSDNSSGPGEGRSRTVFAPETNRLNAYDERHGFAKQIVIPSNDDDPQNGIDVNGMVCFSRDGKRRFLVGEDTGQPARTPGWGYFQLKGQGKFSATEIGKLIPTYQDSLDNREPYGCGFLSDGRALTTDVGNQASGPPTGQLIIWFPPFAGPFGSPRYCKLDIAIGTAGGIYVDDQDRVYVASARGDGFGVLRYTGSFPTSDDAAGGCGSMDGTGAPLATQVNKEQLITGGGMLPAPSGITSYLGVLYVSSVINGAIIGYDTNGGFYRTILRPQPGEQAPFSTGTPFGLAVDSEGSIYYADLGVVISLPDIGPGPNLGTVRRIQFDGTDAPEAPETIDSGLNFPDGIAVLEERRQRHP